MCATTDAMMRATTPSMVPRAEPRRVMHATAHSMMHATSHAMTHARALTWCHGVDTHFSHTPPFNRRDSLLFLKNFNFEKKNLESPLILFYFKGKIKQEIKP